MGNRRRIAVAAAALIAIWLAVRWWRDDGDSTQRAARSAQAAQPPAARHYRNGQWVSDEPNALFDALGKVRYRPGGLFEVSGTIRDYDTHAPIPGAEMVLAGPLGENSAFADDDGHYSILVHPGPYRSFARADGYIAVGERPMERVPSQPDANQIGLPEGHIAPALDVDRDHAGVDIFLTGAAEIYGTVYDAYGAPIPEALVVAERASHGSSGVTRPVLGTHIDETDLDGTYHLTVPAGFITIDATHIAYAGIRSNRSRVVAPGDRVRMDLTLAQGCIIAGTAVDSNGYRVDEGSLERRIGGIPPNDYAPAARIDPQGDFRLSLTEEGDVTLRAWPWKSGPSQPQTFNCYDGARYEGVVLVAQDLDADLEGSVVDADGEPIAHAFVDILPLEGGGMAQQERADKFGEWAVYQLPAGPYRVQAHIPGKGVAAEIIDVPARGVRLELGGTGSLTGRVLGIDEGVFTMIVSECAITDTDGLPIAQFDDVSMPDMKLLVPVAAGEFRVDGLPACTVAGRVQAGLQTDWFRATIPSGGVGEVGEIDLRPPEQRADISGNVPPQRW